MGGDGRLWLKAIKNARLRHSFGEDVPLDMTVVADRDGNVSVMRPRAGGCADV